MKYLTFILLACSLVFAQQSGQFGRGAPNNNVTLTTPGSTNSVGLLYQVSSLRVPATPTVTYTGTAGAGTWDYQIVMFDAYGNQASVPSANGACSAAATTLSAGATCTIPCPATWATFDGNVATCSVYRTVSAGTPANLSLVCSGVVLGGNCVDNGSVNTASVTPGVFVGTGAVQTVFSYPIKANQIPAGKCARATVYFLHSTGTASVGYNFAYGSGSSGVNSSATTAGLFETGIVCNEAGTTQAQFVSLTHGASLNTVERAVDSTAQQNFVWQFNVASTDQITPRAYIVELLQ